MDAVQQHTATVPPIVFHRTEFEKGTARLAKGAIAYDFKHGKVVFFRYDGEAWVPHEPGAPL